MILNVETHEMIAGLASTWAKVALQELEKWLGKNVR